MTAPVPSGAPYFLVDKVWTGPGSLTGPEGRHAATVRRMRVGETLVLTDGAGQWAEAEVTGVGQGQVELLAGPTMTVDPPALTVTVVQALPKGERSDLAVDLATEAGVDRLVPWSAARCVARWSGDKAVKGVTKWRAVARETAKQARRATVPDVSDLADTTTVVGLIARADMAWVLHESGSVPATTAPLPEQGELVLVIGPEGGIAPQELAVFTAAGAHPVRLGPEVLRTSTAAAVALGALGMRRRWQR